MAVTAPWPAVVPALNRWKEHYHLMRLKLGDDLTHIRYGNMPRRIASVEDVLALKPELRPEG